MTRAEVEALAWQAFAAAFTREKNLPPDERGIEALRAAARVRRGDPETATVRLAIETRPRDPIVPNDISDGRARRIVSAAALKHDTTSEDVKASGGSAETVAAREEAAYELARAGFSQRAIAEALGRKRHAGVPGWIENHEARIAVRVSVRKEARGG